MRFVFDVGYGAIYYDLPYIICDVRPHDILYRYIIVLSRYTEIPNRYPILGNTDTDTDVGIHNTEKYRISTIKYRKYRTSVRYLPPGTENFITERVHIICKLNLYIDVIYNLNIV